MIPGGAVNNTPRSCVPGFRSLVCFIKMHCIVSTSWLACTGDCRTIRAALIDKLSSSRRRLFTLFILSIEVCRVSFIKVLLLFNLWIRWRWPQDATSLLNFIWPLVPRASPHFSR
ncbi:hypothetical protein N7519_007043 [Penicillium mononematosum]|uniref:uncharacterized protein n=1 Tax=Penicillium mononematosum TaxID=268346 RepID=UPI00254771D9|nr:uncharacterized protein N7519_007043 [Penicillium mononematosum]KAJ6185742.1 hypothetical protein N7519_007043 [Penicillium mononematosum]